MVFKAASNSQMLLASLDSHGREKVTPPTPQGEDFRYLLRALVTPHYIYSNSDLWFCSYLLPHFNQTQSGNFMPQWSPVQEETKNLLPTGLLGFPSQKSCPCT